jgi:hypothetical protein
MQDASFSTPSEIFFLDLKSFPLGFQKWGLGNIVE